MIEFVRAILVIVAGFLAGAFLASYTTGHSMALILFAVLLALVLAGIVLSFVVPNLEGRDRNFDREG